MGARFNLCWASSSCKSCRLFKGDRRRPMRTWSDSDDVNPNGAYAVRVTYARAHIRFDSMKSFRPSSKRLFLNANCSFQFTLHFMNGFILLCVSYLCALMPFNLWQIPSENTLHTPTRRIFLATFSSSPSSPDRRVLQIDIDNYYYVLLYKFSCSISVVFVHLQLPDLRNLDCRVDFSTNTFRAVVNLCKDLGIRHPEELSLCKPLESAHLKRNYSAFPKRKFPASEYETTREYIAPAADTNSFIPTHSTHFHNSNGSLDSPSNGTFFCAPVQHTSAHQRYQMQPISSPNGVSYKSINQSSIFQPFFMYFCHLLFSQTWIRSSNGYNTFNDTSSSFGDLTENLASSPRAPSPDVRTRLVKPKSLVERARMNVAWLDSSLSIMEQGVRDYDTLCLRFKYYTFFDLNPKYDQVRINQLYEQAKWQLLNEEIDCTEEEMLMFAALQVSSWTTVIPLNFDWISFSHSQFQISLQNDVQQPDSGIDTSSLDNNGDDDIDAALSELQITLEGPNGRANVITEIPELQDYLRFLKYVTDSDLRPFRTNLLKGLSLHFSDRRNSHWRDTNAIGSRTRICICCCTKHATAIEATNHQRSQSICAVARSRQKWICNKENSTSS